MQYKQFGRRCICEGQIHLPNIFHLHTGNCLFPPLDYELPTARTFPHIFEIPTPVTCTPLETNRRRIHEDEFWDGGQAAIGVSVQIDLHHNNFRSRIRRQLSLGPPGVQLSWGWGPRW